MPVMHEPDELGAQHVAMCAGFAVTVGIFAYAVGVIFGAAWEWLR